MNFCSKILNNLKNFKIGGERNNKKFKKLIFIDKNDETIFAKK